MILILLYTAWFSLIQLHSDYVPAERWLVELKTSDSNCLDQWWDENDLNRSGYFKKDLPIEHWMVVQLPANFSGSLEKLPCVQKLWVDRKIEWRNTDPNDPAYINQGDMRLIGMPKAWDVSTGGLTANGDTIVVAVLDDGFDLAHQDLSANIWHNRKEIPGDEIDNDENGYTDDYLGLNILTGDDSHEKVQHGTQVTGVVGAKGNNSIGVTGVNWDVKMMLISGGDYESEIIEGYQYALDMRKKYNQSHGNEGAFVVATNLSGGIDFAFAQDHPLWCDMYNKLGEVGILNVAAGPNNPISVDIDGDMPTTCTSPFLITVTNVDLTDEIMGNAGYGHLSIDIGAPGQGTLTVDTSDHYKGFSGTSAAAPHVAGAIALIYSTPCTTFLQNIETNPEAVALMVADIILTTGADNNSLEDITTTGKRVQVDAAMQATLTDCGVITEESVRIRFIAPNPAIENFAKIFFEVKGDTSTATLDLYTVSGALVSSDPISQEDYQQGYIYIDTKPLASAIYLVTLRNNKNKATAKLFVP